MTRTWVNDNTGEILEFSSETATKSELAYRFLEQIGFRSLDGWKEIPSEK